MGILNKLAIKNLKLNKKRTRIIIIGIILSSILITAVSSLASSYQKSMIENQKKATGDWHYKFPNISLDKLNELQNDRNVEKISITQDIGFTTLNFANNIDGVQNYGYIMAFSENALNNLGINIIEGRLPQNENEIVVQRRMLQEIDNNWKVGDEIVLEKGKRLLDSYELTQDDFYIKDEIFVTEESKNYKIVGIIANLGTFIEGIRTQCYTIITRLENVQDKYINAFVRYNNPNKLNLIGTYDTNTSLINFETNNLSEENLQFLYLLAGIIILIIVIMSVLCIRNSFEISITERIKEYGMLSSNGATSKQIKYSILFEGFLLGLIAIPIGICLGIFLDYIIIYVIKTITNDQFLKETLFFNVNFIAVIISIIINILTIYLICNKSAKRASKISPIEAIRSNKDIYSNYRKLKTSAFIKKVFGIGGNIAYKNLKRNGKKYKVGINSITISVIVFIAMQSFVQYSLQSVDNFYKSTYNVFISNSRNYEMLTNISHHPNVQKYTIKRTGHLYVPTKNQTYRLCSIGDQQYREFVNDMGLNYEETKDNLIALTPISEMKEEYQSIVPTSSYALEEGDVLKGNINEEEVSLKVVTVTTKFPMGFSSIDAIFEPTVIISDELYEKYKFEVGELASIDMYIDANNPYELEDWLLSNYSALDVSNQEEYIRNNKATWKLITVFLYVLIGMITLIGITNIFNAITANMQLRQKEFAILKSIGLTKKEFNKIVNLESIFYGIKSLFIGIPVGVGLSYIIYKIFDKEAEMIYNVPIITILIVSIAILAIIWLIMKYSIKQINKQNIIETIRNDNI